jgi:hypothetical protein
MSYLLSKEHQHPRIFDNPVVESEHGPKQAEADERRTGDRSQRA